MRPAAALGKKNGARTPRAPAGEPRFPCTPPEELLKELGEDTSRSGRGTRVALHPS